MSLMTEPVIKQPRHIPDTRTAKDWLDALATGTCDQRAFLRGLGDLLARSPDSGWDMLALLDQYYRRGKIGAETFTSLKSHLQNLLLGKSGEAAASAGPAPAPAAPVAVATAAPQIPTVRDELVRAAAGGASVVSLPKAEARAPADARGTAAAGPRPAVEPIRQRSTRAPAEGDVLRGRYRLEKRLGQDGLGTVFAALDQYRVDETGSEQRVALKVLHPAVTKRPRLLAELRREFQHLQALSHPNIVRVHEFDRDGDVAFFTMEYLCGATLRRLLAAERPHGFDRGHALAITRDVGAALAHAHSRGMVHGDLSPANIFITDQGDLRVLDFGATPALHRAPAPDEPDDERPVSVEPPTFASCEVLEGAPPAASDDLYSLACIAYLLLAGHHPFQDISSLKARSLRISPRRPRVLTRRQWSALRSGLQLDRAKRPTDVASWVAELGGAAAASGLPQLPSLLASRPRGGSSAGWIAAGLGIALVAAAAWWLPGNVDALRASASQWLAHATALLSSRSSISEETRAALPAGSQTPAADDTSAPATAVAPGDAQPATVAPAAPSAPAVTQRAPAPVAAMPAPAIAATARTQSAAAGADAAPAPGVRAKLELAADNVEVSPGDSTAKIVVRRTRSTRGDASFSWWTESGTAKPGQDFVAVKSETATIPNGKASTTLLVPLVMDPARSQERNFYIVIDEPSDNAVLGRTLTMVTIPPPSTE